MDIFRISCILGIVCNFGLTLFLLAFQEKKSKLSTQLFAGFTFSGGIWNLGAFMFTGCPEASYDAAFFWMQFSYMGAIFAVAFFFHFIVAYLNLKRNKLLYIVYFAAIIVSFFNWYSRSRYFLGDLRFVPNFQFYWLDALKYKNPLYFVFYISFFWILLGYGFFLLIEAFRKSVSQQRNKLRYLILAVGFGWIGTNPLFLQAFRIDIYPYTNFLVALYPLFVAYAVIRHQVMDIELIIKKTLVFASLFAIVLGIFIGITLVTQELIVGGKILGLAISSIIIIFAVRPLEDFLVKVTDKYLFQKKYDYKQILKSFIDEVITVLSLERIVESTIDLLNKTLHPENVDILLFNKYEGKYVSYKAIKRNEILTVGNDAQLVVLLRSTKNIILVGDDKYIGDKGLIKEMQKLKAELAIPLVLNEDLIGIMLLGNKKSDEEYNKEDIDILTDLARTEAIAIKNSQVLNELAEQKKVADLGKMMSFLSHNINNHLGRARNRLQTIMYTEDVVNKLKDENLSYDKRKDIAEKLSQHLDLVDKYIEASASVVKKARDFAKPSQGAFASLNVEKSLNTAIDMVKELKYKKSVRQIPIYLEIEKGIPGANAKEEDLREVTIAILDNAMDAIRMKELQLGKDESDNVKVKVAHLKNANQIEIRFIDTGIGIKPEDKESIFLPYFTTKGSSALYESFARRKEIESGNSQEDKVVGTGLGLDLVKNLVENLMKGSMRIESEYKKGATFIVNIPVWSETRI